MNTNELKRFAQTARIQLTDQVKARLKLVLQIDSAELREKEQAVKELKEQIFKTSEEAVIEKVAYTWFNRFCALRFMDVNRYTKVGAISPAEGFSQPEILQEAKQGHIDDDLKIDRQKVYDLLSGKDVASDPQQEAYRLLLVSVCNSYHKQIPFMFEQIADYTELLVPEDLLSENSILHAVRNALNEENCNDVEVVGWLYQFYISEKKDQVFEGLKKNKKITPENIPAVTQLFTPHWIVRYLVENSLGRLWMLNRPQSQLTTKMEYYIKPEVPETDFLKIASPEEIKICDPACGSGHMLTYTFDLLYAIYEEEGYDLKEIPGFILSKNLYGVEIDERAGSLAAFALTMKAREKYRRFFRKPALPNICVLHKVVFDDGEIKNYMDAVGRDLFTMNFQNTLHQFEEADNFGSLIRPDETNVAQIHNRLDTQGIISNMFLMNTHKKVLRVLKQADYLSPKYHVVIANPPYMGGKGMNGRLGSWLKDNYEIVKSDLFSAFIIRCSELAINVGYVGVMSPNVWMYISSHEKLRSFIVQNKTITNLVELSPSGFKGAGVQICAYNFINTANLRVSGAFIRLVEFKGSDSEMASYTREAIINPECNWFYRCSANDFKKIPGNPIAYWVSSTFRSVFLLSKPLSNISQPRLGMTTGDNSRFIRLWYEVPQNKIGYNCIDSESALKSRSKWFPYNKGGGFRRWYGNKEYVVNWENNGKEILHYNTVLYGSPTRNVRSIKDYFRESITWSFIGGSNFGVRYSSVGAIFDVGGSSIFPNSSDIKLITGFLCTKVVFQFLKAMNPTLNFQAGNVANLPILSDQLALIKAEVETTVDTVITISKNDWDSYETSWDFRCMPLLQSDHLSPSMSVTYLKLRNYWFQATVKMQQLEDENNQTFIKAYGLQDELTPEVPINEISLTCNPHYRHKGDKTEEELETLLLADTMKEFISYAVGCMLGRYSIDKPGLILANEGDTLAEYLQKIPEPSFQPDTDNVIPILDGEWFVDDIAARFRKFLKVTFGEEHFEDNLVFIEDAIGKDIRKFFLKDFYADHVKRYKKRPIYWLFSSPKGSFNALIYMHRYRPDTVSIVLNDYLREFRTKLVSHRENLEAISISATANKTEKTKALKEIEKTKKTVAELEDYERDTLYPLATQKIEIDLDDGVKVNYKKFGTALKKVAGLS